MKVWKFIGVLFIVNIICVGEVVYMLLCYFMLEELLMNCVLSWLLIISIGLDCVVSVVVLFLVLNVLVVCMVVWLLVYIVNMLLGCIEKLLVVGLLWVWFSGISVCLFFMYRFSGVFLWL